jgi:hypothetical protein
MKFPALGYGKPLNMKWIRSMVTKALLLFLAVHYVYLLILNNALTNAFYARASLLGKRSQLASKYPIVFKEGQLVQLAKAEALLALPTSASETCHTTEKTVGPLLLTWVYVCSDGSRVVATVFLNTGEFTKFIYPGRVGTPEQHVYFLKNDPRIEILVYEDGVVNQTLAASTSPGVLFSLHRNVSFSYRLRDVDGVYACRHEVGNKNFSDYKEGEFDTEGEITGNISVKDSPVLMTVVCNNEGVFFGETVMVYPSNRK